MSSTAKNASVETKGAKHLPLLMEGTVTPEAIHLWEMYFRIHFNHKAKQVSAAAGGLQDPLILEWYWNDAATFDALTFAEFMAQFHTRWLPSNWKQKVNEKIIRSRQKEDETFASWIDSLMRNNSLLVSTPLRLSESDLRRHIGANAVSDVRDAASTEEVIAIQTFKDWKDALILVDDKRQREKKKRQAEFATLLSQYSRPSSSAFNSRTLQSRTNSPTVPSSSNATKKDHVPKLTEDERAILVANNGCFKCRRLNVDHKMAHCPNGLPDPAKYKTITQADVKASGPASARVATITDENATTLTVGAVRGESPPAVFSSVLEHGEGSESDDEYVTPISVPHLVLQGILHALSCLSDPVPMLIDSGAPTVLINEQLVDSLQLRRRKLPQPITMGSAFGEGQSVAVDWVRLRISTQDLSWTASRSVCALVVPSLCNPVVLGLPFFVANHLVLDPECNSVTDKKSNRNILCPILRGSVDTRSAKERRKDNQLALAIASEIPFLEDTLTRTRHRDMHRELLLEHGARDTTPPPLDVVTAIHDRIEELALLARLEKEDATLRSNFADCFPSDIPHVDRLPDNVYHRFRLKDPNLIIVRRRYDCLKKYREVWKELLKEHLDAGRLRESSSSYASPAFLIPKSDPTAKPRWVNDYRKLNDNTIPDVHPLPSIQEILSDCGKGKIWGKMDMTNSFFQTRVHPDDVKYTAVTTPFGLYEWTVMPQGCRNAPATHQRRMFATST